MAYDVPALIDELNSVKSTRSKRRRRRFITKLALCDDDRAVDELCHVLKSDDDEFSRALAAKGLGRYETAAALAALISVSSDGSPKVRAQVALALSSYKAPESVDMLERLLKEDSNEAVQQTAASGLARLSELGGQDALLRALDHDSATTRRFVIYAIGETGDKSLIPIIQARQNGETRLNRGAIQSVVKSLNK